MAKSRSRKETKYNENFFRGMGGPGPTTVGIIVVILVVIGLYLAFTKSLPWSSNGYTVKATFANAVNISKKAPVRIAGVNVGKVISVERKGNNSVVEFTVDGDGQPVHDDATVQIRPRIFLEGNFFVDLDPGSPSAPDLDSGGSIPLTRTSTAVQLDEVLTALQKPERENLVALLQGLGTGFTYEPTAADDADQDPSVQGLTAAEALNKAYDTSADASRTTAIVNQAFLGTKEGDLAGLLRANDRVFRVLAQHETQLQGLVSNFNTFTGALADESGNLSDTIRLLAPTPGIARRSLVSLNAALPPVRALAIATRPGIAELPATIAAGRPWLRQAKPLLGNAELGGTARLLAEGTPYTAAATYESIQGLPEISDFNRCVSHNLIPAGNVVLDDDDGSTNFSTGQPNYREFFYSLAGVAGETQNFDGNGIYVRFQPGGGPVAVQAPNPRGASGGFLPANVMYGNTISAPLGTKPALNGKPPIRSDVKCYKSKVPDLNGPAADPGPPSPVAVSP